jgi:uncharacterized heparinase superfamily protein
MASPRAWFYRSSLYNLALWGPIPASLDFRLPETWPGDADIGRALIGAAPDWTAENHRFGFLADLAALGGDESSRTARILAEDWLKHCDQIEPVSWSAEALGDRLYMWIAFHDLIAGAASDAAWRQALLLSLARQMRHLSRIWKSAEGVGRLVALRGLVIAAAALKDRRRLARACGFLATEAKAQILPDGGHASRNPEAIRDALQCLIDARDALGLANEAMPKEALDAIDRAAPLLRFFRHGDGRLALFNGAAESETERLDLVLQRADAKGRPPLRAPFMGYERLQAGRSLVIADCGGPPPRGQDIDAHAGALAFEMSHGRERLIVNCGAYRGADPAWTLAMRQSAAHSTLILADVSSAEIGHAGHFAGKTVTVKATRNEEDGNQWLGASHDGYVAAIGLKHEREIYLSADGEDIRGEDRLVGTARPGREGRGFAIRFHLHPDVQASTTQDGNAVLLRLPSGIGWRLKVAGAVVNLAESVYLGAGGMRRSQQVILSGHAGGSGSAVKWALKREANKKADATED